jgi:hypothetical protein
MFDLLDEMCASIIECSVEEYIELTKKVPDTDVEYLGDLLSKIVFQNESAEKEFKEYFDKLKNEQI